MLKSYQRGPLQKSKKSGKIFTSICGGVGEIAASPIYAVGITLVIPFFLTGMGGGFLSSNRRGRVYDGCCLTGNTPQDCDDKTYVTFSIIVRYKHIVLSVFLKELGLFL